MFSIFLMSQTEHSIFLPHSNSFKSYAHNWSSREVLKREPNVSVNGNVQKFNHLQIFQQAQTDKELVW